MLENLLSIVTVFFSYSMLHSNLLKLSLFMRKKINYVCRYSNDVHF